MGVFGKGTAKETILQTGMSIFSCFQQVICEKFHSMIVLKICLFYHLGQLS